MSVQVVDKGWERITKELQFIDSAYVKVGYPEEKEQQHDNAQMTVAHLAAIHEHGADDVGIPARPFMAQSFDKNRKEIEQQQGRLLSDIYEGKKTAQKALDTLGIFFKGKVQKEIGTGDFVENKKATKARKDSTKPLIDKGQLQGSVDHEVVMK